MSAQTVTAKKKQLPASRKRGFEQFLLDEKYLTGKQMADVHMRQSREKESFEQSATASGFLDEEKLTRARARFFRLPYIDLRSTSISKETANVLSRETIENYQLMPFAREGSVVKIALTDPTDLRALEALEFLAEKNKYRVELYLSSPGGFQEAVKKGETISTEVGEALETIKEKESVKKPVVTRAEPEPAREKITAEEPITKIVNVLISHAIRARASDIHIEPQENDLRIRYRVDGVLHSSLVVPKIVHPAIVSRIKILSNLKIDEQRLPQDGRFHMNIDRHSIDFRVSTLPTVSGEKVVMRILDKSGGVPTPEQLGLSGLKLARLMESIKKPHGMVLVTGPTGSGKSTTLYAVLNILNEIGVNIVTLEDPVEYYIDGVNQSQINPDIGLTFASGLRSILRQDPNVIMVGEIRDKETAELAVHSALTGHLVFSTLHTNDAVGAIPRLLDMGIEAFLLTASLNLVVGQRLVRVICEHCKKEVAVPEKIGKMIADELAAVPAEELGGVDIKNPKMYSGEGCEKCGHSGYQGRIGIFEVLPLSENMRNIVLERNSSSKIRQTALSEGMVTMRQDGLTKVLQGKTTIEEVLRVTKE